MSGIEFAFNWDDPGGARGAELRATWAQLQIRVEGEVVTRLIDRHVRAVRDAVYLPLYPLAEWLATHWWVLLHEAEVPGRAAFASYETRHNLGTAGEGFALPNLSIRPTGAAMHLVWRRVVRTAQRVEFTAEGSALIDAASFRDQVGRFVDVVVSRLGGCDVHDTLLQREWEHVRSVDADEAEFYAAAASLGLDPYAIDDDRRDAIIAVNEALPAAVRSSFFESADAERLVPQAAVVNGALQLAQAHPRDRRVLDEVRHELRALDEGQGLLGTFESTPTPWVRGHTLACQLRALLNLDGQPLQTSATLARALRIGDPRSLQPDAVIPVEARAPFDAVVAVGADRGPGFVVSARSAQAQRFAVCRALYEFLDTGGIAPRLVTGARTAGQQSSRAFAAEFLAPVAALRQRLSGVDLFDEEADEIAAEFGVSPLVVRHQLENHGIIRVRTDRPPREGSGL